MYKSECADMTLHTAKMHMEAPEFDYSHDIQYSQLMTIACVSWPLHNRYEVFTCFDALKCLQLLEDLFDLNENKFNMASTIFVSTLEKIHMIVVFFFSVTKDFPCWSKPTNAHTNQTFSQSCTRPNPTDPRKQWT